MPFRHARTPRPSSVRTTGSPVPTWHRRARPDCRPARAHRAASTLHERPARRNRTLALNKMLRWRLWGFPSLRRLHAAFKRPSRASAVVLRTRPLGAKDTLPESRHPRSLSSGTAPFAVRSSQCDGVVSSKVAKNSRPSRSR